MRTVEYKYDPIHRFADTLPSTALALGLFDGVHIGHRRLIEKTVEAAKDSSLVPGIFTFRADSTLPKRGDSDTIYTTEEKLELFAQLGIELVIIADFSSICELSALDFITDVLFEDLNCRMAGFGYNFRFGKGAVGDAAMLVREFELAGRSSILLEEQMLDGQTVSSTRIRALLSEGNAEAAGKLLGAPYHLSGRVEKGLGLGHRFGFPTINTQIPKSSPLAAGVYRTAVDISGVLYNAVTNIGRCPTFGEREKHAETMILDFSENIYGKKVRIYILGLIRAEKKFKSPEQLREQIEKDASEARKKNGETKWAEIGLSSQ